MAKLTTKFVTKVQSDNIKVFWDDQLKGFGLCVRPSGKKTFLLKYRIGRGRRALCQKKSIGFLPIMSVEVARLKAKNFLFIASQGIDPIKKDQDFLTIKELCVEYIDSHAVLNKKKSSLVRDQNLIKGVVIPVFGKFRVVDLKRSHLRKYHNSKKESTPIMANRFLALLSKMMNLAEEWEYRPLNSNPCKHIKRHPETKRTEYLSLNQLKKISQAMHQLKDIESPYVLGAIQMLIFTGCRTGEILSLKWEYIDFKNSCMNLPDTKTGERNMLLNPTALSILASLEKKSAYVFVSRVENKQITTIRLTWKKICKIAGLADVRPHDLRHTFASHAVNYGYSLPIIAKLLGHADTKTTERYVHLDEDPIKKANDDVSLKLKKVMEL